MRSSTTTFLEHHWECLFVKWNIMLAMHLTYVLAPRLCLLLYWSRCIAPLLYQSVQATVWENLKSKKLSCHLAYVDIYVDESSRLKSITSTSNFSLSPFNLWLHLQKWVQKIDVFTTLVVCPVKVLVFLNCLFLLFLLWSVWILFLKWFRKSVEFSGIIWGQLYLLKLLCCIGHLDDERLHIYF